MAYSSITKPSDYFNSKLYTGNNSTQSITGVGFQPDLTWIKSRGTTTFHNLYNSVRGATKLVQSNTSTAEQTFSDGLTSFDSDGFSLGSRDDVNGSSYSLVSWNWKSETYHSGTTTGSGSERSYSARVNTTSGISIINYQGNSTSGHTIPHNLGAVPKIVMIKNLGDTGDWIVHMGALNDPEKVTSLNTTAAGTNFNAGFNTTTPTSSVFTLGNSVAVNDDNQQYLAICFTEIKGYSKFGSYVGNGNSDGAFVYTGFKPAFVMFKRSSGTGNWQLLDSKRLGYNVENRTIYPNSSTAEQDEDDADILSNGFKLRGSGTDGNGSGSTYIYMAFAEHPLVANVNGGIPATAR